MKFFVNRRDDILTTHTPLAHPDLMQTYRPWTTISRYIFRCVNVLFRLLHGVIPLEHVVYSYRRNFPWMFSQTVVQMRLLLSLPYGVAKSTVTKGKKKKKHITAAKAGHRRHCCCCSLRCCSCCCYCCSGRLHQSPSSVLFFVFSSQRCISQPIFFPRCEFPSRPVISFHHTKND